MTDATPASLPPLTPWQQRVYEQAASALDARRLGHGLLICGPDGLGQRIVAERLAQRLLCREHTGNDACGQCRSCRLFASRSQTDPVELRPNGDLAHPFGHPGHPDAIFIGYGINQKAKPPKSRSEIVIEQIRKLSQRLALTPQYGGAQIVILEPADAINHAACNALLKTLEEPSPDRHLWLIAANPARLPATIRSRCQKLEFRLPPRDEALAWLATQGHTVKMAEEALDAARGHPGLADAWLRDNGLQLRREVANDLQALQRGDSAAPEVAQRWAGDEYASLRLRHAADLALTSASGGLTDPQRTRRLAAWFDAANRARDLLRTTVRTDLVIADVLLAWCDLCRPAERPRGFDQSTSGGRMARGRG